MKLLIEIPEHVYEHAKEMTEDSRDETTAIKSIREGVPITDGGICDLCKMQNFGAMAICFHCNAELKE